MAKVIDKGQAPKDHPMFSGGPQLFSPQRFKPQSAPTPPTTDGETQEASASIDPAELPLALTLARATARPADSASSPAPAATPASKGPSKSAHATTPPPKAE